MKIALATNDRKTIAKRTGRTKEFAIFEIIDSKIVDVVYKENTHKHHDHDHDHEEEHDHSHAEIIDLLKDIDLLIVYAIGKNFKKDVESANLKYAKTKFENIEEILKEHAELL